MTTRHHIAEIIGERTLHVTDSKKLAKEIAAYLLAENRTSELESLMRDVMEYRAQRGVVEAVAVSAHSLSDDVKRQLKHIAQAQYPHAKKVLLDEKQDADLIGGVKLELPEKQLDLTVRGKLNAFKRLTTQERV